MSLIDALAQKTFNALYPHRWHDVVIKTQFSDHGESQAVLRCKDCDADVIVGTADRG